MTSFRSTAPRPSRLTRLGVVLDTRNAPDRLRELARMCDRAGLDSVWFHDHLAAPDGEPRLEAWTAATLAAALTEHVRIGVMCTQAFRSPSLLAAMAGTLDAASGGRLELGLSAGRLEAEHRAFGFDFPDTAARSNRLRAYAAVVRALPVRAP